MKREKIKKRKRYCERQNGEERRGLSYTCAAVEWFLDALLGYEIANALQLLRGIRNDKGPREYN